MAKPINPDASIEICQQKFRLQTTCASFGHFFSGFVKFYTLSRFKEHFEPVIKAGQCVQCIKDNVIADEAVPKLCENLKVAFECIKTIKSKLTM